MTEHQDVFLHLEWQKDRYIEVRIKGYIFIDRWPVTCDTQEQIAARHTQEQIAATKNTKQIAATKNTEVPAKFKFYRIFSFRKIIFSPSHKNLKTTMI